MWFIKILLLFRQLNITHHFVIASTAYLLCLGEAIFLIKVSYREIASGGKIWGIPRDDNYILHPTYYNEKYLIAGAIVTV